jgi:hypothetical protein
MAASNMKKKAQSGVALTSKKAAPKEPKLMSPSLREVPGTRKPFTDKQKDSTVKAWEPKPKKVMKSGGKMKKK